MAAVFLTTEMKEAYELHALWKRRFLHSLHACARPECERHRLDKGGPCAHPDLQIPPPASDPTTPYYPDLGPTC